jgi:hypothetical protein
MPSTSNSPSTPAASIASIVARANSSRLRSRGGESEKP